MELRSDAAKLKGDENQGGCASVQRHATGHGAKSTPCPSRATAGPAPRTRVYDAVDRLQTLQEGATTVANFERVGPGTRRLSRSYAVPGVEQSLISSTTTHWASRTRGSALDRDTAC